MSDTWKIWPALNRKTRTMNALEFEHMDAFLLKEKVKTDGEVQLLEVIVKYWVIYYIANQIICTVYK